MSRYSTGKTGLLSDNSWIKKPDDEDEAVDQDPNFGRSVLGRTKADETSVSSSEAESVKTSTTPTKSSSVLSLSKRFGGGLDDTKSSVSSTKTSTTYQKKYSTVKTDTPSSVTTTVKEQPKTSTTTTTVTKNGVTTETTTTSSSSSSQIIKSPEIKTSTAFTERVKSSSKDAQYSTYTPTRTTKVTEKTVASTKDAEDKLFDTLTPSPSKDDTSTTNRKTTVTTTETVKVKSSSDADAENKLYDSLIPMAIKSDVPNGKSTLTSTETVTIKSSFGDDADDDYTRSSFKESSSNIKTSVTSTETWTVKSSSNIDTKTTKTSFGAEDKLYDSLLPKAITSSPISTKKEITIVETSKGSESPTLSTPTSLRTSSYSSYTDDTPSTRTSSYSNSYSKTYSYSRPDTSYEYTSVTSPSVFTSPSYKNNSWSDDTQTSLSYSKSSSVYTTPERPVLEKDLCTVCRKPFTGDAKMILDDMKINCHATCFKCHVCHGSLSNMKAGDSMWIYKRMVHCENCFEDTREKWRR